MRDRIVWKPVQNMPLEAGGFATVYVKHWAVPFAGLMAAADTAFTVPAYIRRGGKRVQGFVTPADGHAYMQEHGTSHFIEYKG